MFYSDVILSKRGPLARVWLAAHAERRLSKAQLIHTDIEESVATIIGEDDEPIALRISGQLLLGIVRIYSRQTKYLLDDCNEALLRLKTAFRSGALDNTDMAPGTRQAVTLPVTRTAYDLSLPDPAFEGWEAASSVGASEGRHSNRYTARPADITLQRFIHGQPVSSPSGWASGDFFDPNGGQGTASPTLPALERRDSEGRIVDANGDPIDAADETFSSIGVGRDAQTHPGGRASLLGGDLTGFDDFGADDFLIPDIGGTSAAGGLDLGLEQFEAERQRSMTPARGSLSMLNELTPQTKRKIQQAAVERTKIPRKAPRHVVDPHTELNDGMPGGRRSRSTDALLLHPEYLPASRESLRLLEIQAKGLLPFTKTSSGQILATALGLAPQLQELYTFDPAILRKRRNDANDDEEQVIDDDFGSEIGRRAEPNVPDYSFGDNDFGGFELGLEVGDDTAVPQLEIEDMEMDEVAQSKDAPLLRRSTRIRDSGFPLVDEQEDRRQRAFHDVGALDRLSTPSQRGSVARDLDLSPTASDPLRAFEAAPASSDIASVSDVANARASASLGLSKNAVRAVQVLRQQLAAPTQRRTSRRGTGASSDQATMSFQEVTRNASRRAAAGFFFELLALGTKDCIEVEQDESYGDIRVTAREGLWELPQAVHV